MLLSTHEDMVSLATHVERAASLTQKLFLQFREMDYDFQVLGIESSENRLLIKVDKRPEGKYVKFEPQTTMDQIEKAMVASLNGCSLAAVCFPNLLKNFLRGIQD